MQLAEIQRIVRVSISRNGDFQRLSMITRPTVQCLVFLESESYLNKLRDDRKISSVITKEELFDHVPERVGVAIAQQPRAEFYALHRFLAGKTQFYWKEISNEIANDARVHPDAHLAAHSVRIGKGAVIEVGARILEQSRIDDDAIVRAGCVVSTPGLEIEHVDGRMVSVPHAGGVHICNRVELQANCVVARAVFGGLTTIGEDSKIGHLVNIGHNVEIGKRCIIASNAMIGGSARIGDDVWIGPGAVIANGVRIGDRARISIGAVVINDVDCDARVSGNFAIEHRKFAAFVHSIR